MLTLRAKLGRALQPSYAERIAKLERLSRERGSQNNPILLKYIAKLKALEAEQIRNEEAAKERERKLEEEAEEKRKKKQEEEQKKREEEERKKREEMKERKDSEEKGKE